MSLKKSPKKRKIRGKLDITFSEKGAICEHFIGREMSIKDIAQKFRTTPKIVSDIISSYLGDPESRITFSFVPIRDPELQIEAKLSWEAALEKMLRDYEN